MWKCCILYVGKIHCDLKIKTKIQSEMLRE